MVSYFHFELSKNQVHYATGFDMLLGCFNSNTFPTSTFNSLILRILCYLIFCIVRRFGDTIAFQNDFEDINSMSSKDSEATD